MGGYITKQSILLCVEMQYKSFYRVVQDYLLNTRVVEDWVVEDWVVMLDITVELQFYRAEELQISTIQ